MVFNLFYPALNPHVLVWGTVTLLLVCAHFIDRFVEQRCTRQLKRTLEIGFSKLTQPVNPRPLEVEPGAGRTPGYGRLIRSDRGGGRVPEHTRQGRNPLSSRPSHRPYERAKQIPQHRSKP